MTTSKKRSRSDKPATTESLSPTNNALVPANEGTELMRAQANSVPKIRITEKGWEVEDGSMAEISRAIGTEDPDITTTLLTQMTCLKGPFGPELTINSAVAFCQALKPRDSVEGSLALQMNATASMAMRLLGLASSTLCTEQGAMLLSNAVKLLRTYTCQIEALNRYRGKVGEQKVVVEHVHVNAGGQAIVGSVQGGEGGK